MPVGNDHPSLREVGHHRLGHQVTRAIQTGIRGGRVQFPQPRPDGRAIPPRPRSLRATNSRCPAPGSCPNPARATNCCHTDRSRSPASPEIEAPPRHPAERLPVVYADNPSPHRRDRPESPGDARLRELNGPSSVFGSPGGRRRRIDARRQYHGTAIIGCQCAQRHQTIASGRLMISSGRTQPVFG